MDKRTWVAYSKVHEYLLGRFPSNNTYDDRIIAQKIGYLCVTSGIYLGDELEFFWHKRGPYSRVLASVVRNIERNKDSIIENCSLVTIKESLKHRLDKVRDLIHSKPHSCSETFWLEICASLLFLKKELQTNNIDTLSETLIRKKPFLSDYGNTIRFAWEKIAY